MENNVNSKNATNPANKETIAQNSKKVNNEKITHPRLDKKCLPLLEESDLTAVSVKMQQFRDNLNNLMLEKRLTRKDMHDIFSEYVSSPARITDYIYGMEKRKISLEFYLAFNQKFSDFESSALVRGKQPQPLEELSYAELVCQLEQITAEISRRSRQI